VGKHRLGERWIQDMTTIYQGRIIRLERPGLSRTEMERIRSAFRATYDASIPAFRDPGDPT
jgi:hypothetical protein